MFRKIFCTLSQNNTHITKISYLVVGKTIAPVLKAHSTSTFWAQTIKFHDPTPFYYTYQNPCAANVIKRVNGCVNVFEGKNKDETPHVSTLHIGTYLVDRQIVQALHLTTNKGMTENY